MQGLTIEEKILIHLSRFTESEEYFPFEITQQGIAEAVGTTRNYVAVALGRLGSKNKNLVCFRTAHVYGYPRKLKVYYLTSAGKKKAHEIMEKLKNEKIIVNFGKKEREIRFDELYKYVPSKDALIEIIIESPSKVNLNDIKEELRIFGRTRELSQITRALKNLKNGKGDCINLMGTIGSGKTHLTRKIMELARKMHVPYIYYDYGNKKLNYDFFFDPAFQSDEKSTITKDNIIALISEHKSPFVVILDSFNLASVEDSKNFNVLCTHNAQNPPLLVIKSCTIPLCPMNMKNFNTCRSQTHKSIFLNPLSPDETLALATNLAPQLSENKRHYLAYLSGGNPGILKDIIEHINESIEEISDLNTHIHSNIAEKILVECKKLLSADAEEVFDLLAVASERFPASIIDALTSHGEKQKVLNDLITSGLLVFDADKSMVKFSIPILQLIAMKKLQNRKEEHCKLIKKLEKLVLEKPEIDEYTNLYHHYLQCGNLRGGAIQFLKMSERYTDNKRRYYFYLKKSYELARMGNEDDLLENIIPNLAMTCILLGDYSKAIEIYNFELCMANTPDEKMLTHAHLAELFITKGDLDLAMKHIQEGEKLIAGPSKNAIDLLSKKLWIQLREGNAEACDETLKRMERMAGELDDDLAMATAMKEKAMVLHHRGESELAIDALSVAIDIHEKHSDGVVLASLYSNMGILYAELGNMSRAIMFFRLSKNIDEELGNKRGAAQDYTNLGIAHRRKGDLQRAISYFRKAMKIYEEIGAMDSLAVGHYNLGNALIDFGDVQAAKQELNSALELFEEIKDSLGICYVHLSLGELHTDMDNKDAGLIHYKKCLEMGKKLKSGDCQISAYLGLMELAINEKNWNRAEEYNEILDAKAPFHSKSLSARHAHLKAILKYKQGCKNLNLFELAAKKYREAGERLNMARALCDWGTALIETGKVEEGKEKIGRAMKIFKNKKLHKIPEQCKYIER